jgi:glycosyltransferase involved in cell wall biosynthesis
MAQNVLAESSAGSRPDSYLIRAQENAAAAADEMPVGISWIVPAYNEEGAIAGTVHRLQATLSTLGLPFEIIVVNDGSRDATLERAKSVGMDVRVVSHPVNTGYGSAIKTGIRNARYDWLGITDADGTYDIELIPTLVEKMYEGFDMVVAARSDTVRHDRPVKRFFRKCLITGLNILVAGRIIDPNSGFRMFTKTLANTFFPFLCNTFSFTTSLTVFAFGEAFFVAYVPTNYSARVGASKVRHFRDSIRMMQLIMQGINFFNALKFYIILALMMLVSVGLPAVVMVALGWLNLALIYAVCGATAGILIGMGVLADIIRIALTDSSTPHLHDRKTAGLRERK